ncbi:MAG: pyridoxal phosphate-dependent aminotransferase [Candidatus Bathyarchaeota archaeon]|nr:MAG: pyridoxal phosphate-dependent aminotransferase [Candidatus Bathyarchaeota archaeon]
MQTRNKIAERLRTIQPSGIRRLLSSTHHIPGMISLGLGEPNASPPRHVLEATKQAVNEQKTRYTPSNGIEELREALAKKFAREYALRYDPDSEILVTIGATEAISLALMASIDPGDEVLIPDPGFVCYAPAVRIAGGVPVSMPILENDGFKPNLETVMSLITNRSRVMIINSPNNPTGSVFTSGDLKRLSKLVVENGLIAVSDEVYEKITYDNATHHCLAMFPDMRDRTVVVNSFSKSYAMTGFRIGCALGPKDLISGMLLVHQFLITCVDSLSQYAATAALEGPQNFVVEMVSEFNKRRKLVHERLNEIKGIDCTLPKGAFYAFPNIRALRATSENFSEFLFKEAKVIVTPGSSFGKYGEGYLRLSYAVSYKELDEALDRIEKAANKFK